MDISSPSKLLKFKKYLTLPEAAKHLSNVCGEEVAEANILKYALDGYLKLSIYFEGPIYGESGCLEERQWPEYKHSEEVAVLMESERERLCKFSWKVDEKPNKVSLTDKVFDLPMIGNEWIFIEREWKRLHGGSFPSEKHYGLDAILIEDSKGKVYALQEIFDEDSDQLSGPPLGYEEILRQQSKRREKNCYPAWGFSIDNNLLVRIDSLRKFEQLIADNEPVSTEALHNNPDKSDLTETERQKMLKLIIGMAIEAYGYDPESTRNSATGDKNGISAKILNRCGISISDDTIRKYLTEAKNLL